MDQRLNDIQENIRKAYQLLSDWENEKLQIGQDLVNNYALLNDWENELLIADNPSKRRESEQRIAQTKKEIEKLENEKSGKESKIDQEINQLRSQIGKLEKEKEEILSPARSNHIIISYDHKTPDQELAEQLAQTLKDYGHEVFMASSNQKNTEDWYQTMLYQLAKSDYFILLLSEKSLISEMVTEEVKRALELQMGRPGAKPLILTIKVRLGMDESLNFNLANYLKNVYETNWESEADNEATFLEIAYIINNSIQQKPEKPKDLSKTNPDVDYTQLPTPNAPLELPSGSVALDSPFYIEREVDRQLKNEVLKEYVLIKIKGPRQYGKTSLLSRLIDHAKCNTHEIIAFSLQQITKNTLTDLDKFLNYFCFYASEELNLPDETDTRWNPRRDPKHNCRIYFQNYLLPKTNKPILLAIDEADRLFKYKDVSSDFYSMLRNWHEMAKSDEAWKKIKIMIAFAAGEELAIDDVNQSPFNVGLTSNLDEFNDQNILDLAKLHGLSWTQDEVRELSKMVGGHPYLIRKGLYEIASQNLSLRQFLEQAADDDGVFADHLSRHLWFLKRRPDMAKTMKEIIEYQTTSDFINCEILRGLGLIKGNDPNYYASFELYERYLKNKL